MVSRCLMCAWFLVTVSGFSLSVHAQQQPPRLLLDAAHCLAVKEFLPPIKATTLSLGYLVDSESYPGERMLYVVVYTSPKRSHGMVYSIVPEQQGTRLVLHIVNNGEFVRSHSEGASFRKENVDFVSGRDPLGGIWTQEHLARAIKKIGLQPTLKVSRKHLLVASDAVKCESYVENSMK